LEPWDLFNLIPPERFERENFPETLKKLGMEPDRVPLILERGEYNPFLISETWDAIKEDELATGREGMDFLETLAGMAGLPFLGTESTGFIFD
jgi:hypothetical protein